jgi:arylsulfatase A-like enzyme
MIDHDKNAGTILKALDDLGIADNIFVMYSTDNGPHMNSWPDGAMTPFRSEKNTNWEGAYRVPAIFRWPGKIKPGQVSNEIVAHLDMLPTNPARLGQPVHELAGSEMFNLRTDPYERADITSNIYLAARDYVGQFLMTFRDYPQRQKAASFNMDEVLAKLRESGGSKSLNVASGTKPTS